MGSVETNIDEAITLKGNTKQSSHPIAKALHLFFKLGDKLFVNKAGKIASDLWFKPRKFKPSSAEISIIKKAEHRTFKLSDDKTVKLYQWQTSNESLLYDNTVLLVHGWEGRASQFHEFVFKLLEAGYNVISFDAPGHGLSSGKHTDILEFHRVIVYLQNQFGRFAGVIAHSFGAISTAYSINNGLNTDKVVTISAPSHFKGLVYKFQAILGLTNRVTESLSQHIEHRFVTQNTNIWNEFSTYMNARKSSATAMIVHDKNDKEVPYEEGILIHENWEGSELQLTEGLGHKRILTNPEVINAVVHFLSDTQALETVLD